MDKLDKEDYSSNPEVNSIIQTLLVCSLEISDLMENTIVHKIGSTNAFGDEQLHLDVESDNLIEKVTLWNHSAPQGEPSGGCHPVGRASSLYGDW